MSNNPDLTLAIVTKALDNTVAKLAQLQGVNFGELRNQIVYEATVEITSQFGMISLEKRKTD